MIIDHTNFAEYFFDVRRSKPQPGQIMAKFVAIATFSKGQEKRDIIQVLKMGKPLQAAMVMRKIHCCREPDCYRICREICEDLVAGMSETDVEAKEHEFVLEAFYYTKKEYVPVDDHHWQTLEILEFDKETNTFRARN